jgi:hypothetical protein
MGKSPKFYRDLSVTTVDLVGYTCMQDYGFLIQVSKDLV